MRLSDRVFLTLSGDSGCSLSHRSDCNAYAVLCEGEVLLIDAGVGINTESLLRNLAADGIRAEQITTLLLTHGHLDHSGGAGWLHERLGLEVIASQETAAALETGDEDAISLGAAKRAGIYDAAISLHACRVARKLQGGEIWKVRDTTIRAMRTPGHSDDMLSFLLQTPSELLAFTGDTVFHGGRIALQDTHDCRPAAYARSLRALAALPIEGLFPGHGIWSLTRGAAQIQSSLQHLDRLLLPPNAF
jgi:glyoxylase-like metal-dependent hydrolase (beta-lactamase superfamily II)